MAGATHRSVLRNSKNAWYGNSYERKKKKLGSIWSFQRTELTLSSGKCHRLSFHDVHLSNEKEKFVFVKFFTQHFGHRWTYPCRIKGNISEKNLPKIFANEIARYFIHSQCAADDCGQEQRIKRWKTSKWENKSEYFILVLRSPLLDDTEQQQRRQSCFELFKCLWKYKKRMLFARAQFSRE